jgi:hypothetical protein
LGTDAEQEFTMPVTCVAEVKSSDVIVGRDEGNTFSLEIRPTSDAQLNLIVRVEIPFGENKQGEPPFLLKDENERPNVSYRLPAGDKQPRQMDRAEDAAESKNCIAWDTPSTGITIDTNSTMQIDVTGLGGTIPPGIAKVFLRIRQGDDAAFTKITAEKGKDLEVPVKLKLGDEEGVKILYFVVDKEHDYVLHAGEEEVKLSFFVRGAKETTLFKNNTKIWPPPGGSRDLFFKDKPSITSVYRLEAKGPAANTDDREKLLNDKNLVVRYLTVQVAQAGWNRQPLQQGYPTVLMKALSFTSGEAERLYGIFVDPNTVDKNTKEKAVGLYSSETGFPPWRKEPAGEGKDFGQIVFKDHALSSMSHSPGVASGGKLWLIGGSSVDARKCSNEVWYYHKSDKSNEGEWVRGEPGGFPARMGHCVLEFKKRIWLLGGSTGNKPLNDVWSYDPNEADKKEWHPAANAKWPARCLFAALVTPDAGVAPFDKEKIWIYGGTDDPDIIKTKSDLWSTTDGETWTHVNDYEFDDTRAGRPKGVTLFWDESRLHLAGSFELAKTLSAMVYSLCAARFLWEANPVSWGWEQFGGNSFLMRSIVFNRFWFFWSLNRDIKIAPKLNVFIPS